MDYNTYRHKYFVNPPPEPRFKFSGIFGVTLFYEDYEAAVTYYSSVLGPPAYVEGSSTRGWPIGEGWLTLLRGKNGNPRNIEITFVMETTEQAEALQKAFVEAGGKGVPASDQLMFEPIRSCPVTDPCGTDLLIISPLEPSD